MTDPAPAVWYYDAPSTVTGALQHGLGRGAHRALRDPAGAEAVFACVKRDYRWDWMVDQRALYLARLVRDLAMPVPPLLMLLREHPTDNDDNTFDNTLDVLEALGRSSSRHAVDGLRQYVHDGPQWTEVLQTIASDWPRELWDDLLPVARTRLGQRDEADTALWRSRPWLDWAAVDESIAARLEDFQPRSEPPRPFEQHATEDLLTLLRNGGTDRQKAVLRELNHRGPQPDLLTIAEDLPATELYGQLGRAIRMLGGRGTCVGPDLGHAAGPPDGLDGVLGACRAR
jgi:hypothetical protein